MSVKPHTLARGRAGQATETAKEMEQNMKGEVIPGDFPPGAKADAGDTWVEGGLAGSSCAWCSLPGFHQ